MRVHLLLVVVANAIIVVSSTGTSSSSIATSSSNSSLSHSESESFSTSNSQTSSTSNDSKSGKRTCGVQGHGRKCRKHERYVDCVEALCQPQTCDDLGYDVPCPILGPDDICPGKPGCVCRENYVRNHNGKCIRKEKCPSCGGDPNAVSGCGTNCGRLCSNYNQTDVACILSCDTNGCDCKKDYVFDDIRTKKCVFPEQCPTTTVCNKPNEVYDLCPAPCPPRRCDVNEALILCAVSPQPGDPECEPGCRCADGFVKNATDICIPKEECPTCPNPNEVYDTCIAPCPPRRCDVDDSTIRCAAPPKIGDPGCESGCRCADGYYRNDQGVCVTKNECTSCGDDPNAQPGCGINCGRLCSNYNKGPVACTALCKLNACDCKPDYVFDENTNKCVLPEECTPICGQYEEYSSCINGGCGPKNCSQIGQPVKCLKIPAESCIKGCKCQEGFLRADNGNCVPEKECPGICTGENEIYEPCPVTCPPQTCRSINQTYHCPLISPDSDNCHGACRCKPGYYRNYLNQCISENNCLKCTGPNEYYSCGGACDNVCKTLSEQNQTNCPIINIKCNEMCYCEEGYARDENKICIPIEQCKVPQCGKHEIYVECISSNTIQNCSQLGYPFDLSDDSGSCTGGPGCVCKHNYLRNDQGICVPRNECPPACTGQNEVYDPCPPKCPPQICESIYSRYNCPLELVNQTCTGACRCQSGYFRNKNNQCVSTDDCLKCTGPNEYFSCGGACDNVCKTLSEQNQTNCPIVNIKCNEMCYCLEGYARDENNICVPIDHCKVSCGGDPNAQPGCGQNCGRRCSNYNKGPVACALVCKENGCDCKPGYVYDDNIKQCVLPENCTPVCGYNEVYSDCIEANCKAQTCTQLRQSIPCPRIDPSKCTKGCLCKEGYVRSNGTCISENKCPSCGENERVEDCPTKTCDVENCSQLGYPLNCEASDDTEKCPVAPVCVCIDGYVRNKRGKCIPKDKCPSCGGDPNAISGCGVNCNKRCSDLNGKPKGCIRICYPNACDCRHGYYYDEITKKCVKPEHCPPICGQYEEYSSCINGGCGPKHCSQIGQPVKCLKIPAESCIKGCKCQEGFLRADNGNCVPEKECPGICTGENEIYEPCPVTCPPQTCRSINQTYHCPLIRPDPDNCHGACRCKPGYYRNYLNQCISENNCLKCTGPNEYYSCGGACDNVCKTLSEQNQTNCPIINIKCNEMCYCEEGYARDENKICIPIEQCKVPQCGKHEIYVECISSNTIQNCSQLGYPFDLSDDSGSCTGGPGCVCEHNYLRNDQGICVPRNECPPACTGQNEVYDPCPPKCPPQICESIYSRYNCPLELVNQTCTGACRCQSGYFRNKNNQCVSTDDCLKCTGPNEYFSCGGACDNVCKTLSEQNQTNCPIVNIKCNEMCYCLEGYARDENNICVPIDHCKVSCGGDPNAQPGCGQNCGRRCSNYNKGPVACALVCKENGCDCKPGYVYDDHIKQCVLPENCTPVCGYNEVYSDCIEANCKPQTCTQLGQSIPCPRIDPSKCTKGCLCKEGYVRSNGTCIPENKCPSCGENERVEDCPTKTCDAENCSQLGYPLNCEASDDTEKCPVAPACVCIDGYVRNKRGKCIPKDKCPSCGGDPNAISGCGVNCNKRCSDLNGKPKGCIRICYPNACDCRHGYYYDEITKKCVKPEHCPPQCGPNEKYTQSIMPAAHFNTPT